MKKLLISAALASLIATSAFSADVVATVNGKNLTMDDVASFLKAMPGVDYNNLAPDVKQKVVTQVVERQLLIEEALKSGVETSDTYKDELERAKNEIALDVWMKKQYDQITVSDDEAKKFYDANGDKFNQPELYNARHIIVKSKSEADKILKELKSASKANLENAFAAAAQKYSIDGTKNNGGELGWFSEGRMVKEFFDAAKALKKGEMSKSPVKTQFGYHLIYLVDKKPAGKVPFEAAKEQIKQIVKMDKFKQTVAAKAKALREQAKVEIK